VRLKNLFSYIDASRRRWDVPKDAIVDGASIPRMLWTLIGGPFKGKYRNASIIHDWYCDLRLRPWQQVHRMFFDAMITSSVSAGRAKLLYAGVYLGGPRWSKTVVENTRLATGYRSPGRYRSSDGGGAHRVKFAVKRSTGILRTTKTVTVLRKYQMRDADLDWLNDQIRDSSQSLRSIERMVDQHLASRTPRERKI
jgi:Protein of unknown function (DUF1353)